MDPLSITASIIAVVQFTERVVNVLHGVKDSSEDRNRCIVEASSLSHLLMALRAKIGGATQTDPWFEATRELDAKDGPLSQYQDALEQLIHKITLKSGIGKAIGTSLWSFIKKDVKDLFGKIERLETLIIAALTMDHFKLSQAIKNDTQHIKNDTQHIKNDTQHLKDDTQHIMDDTQHIKDHAEHIPQTAEDVKEVRRQQDEQRSKAIADWLSSNDYFDQQQDFSSKRQEGTGTWILESRVFQAWVDGSNTALFCTGVPGAGKTMFSSFVVDHLRKIRKVEEIGICFLYCNYKTDKDRKVIDFLSVLLKQLILGLSCVPSAASALYDEHQKNKTRPLLGDISKAILGVCDAYPKVYIVIDALDECPVEYRDDLISEVKKLWEPNVRLLVTSRPISTVSGNFENWAKLQIETHGEDVKTFVEGRVSQLAGCVSRNRELKQLVISGIQDAVVESGIFLLAQLQIHSLKGKTTPKAIKAALKTLPKGHDALSETYMDAVERIRSQAPALQDLAKRALSWIVYARGALNTKELQHALAIEQGKREFDEENITEMDDILAVCAGLVTVDEQSDVVRLIHYTAQEYFIDSCPLDAHKIVAMGCINYLSFDAFGDGVYLYEDVFLSLVDRFALYRYAAGNWAYHVHTASTEEEEEVLNFLCDEEKLSSSAQFLVSGFRRSRVVLPGRRVKGMHLAAYFGLWNTMMALHKKGYDLCSKDDGGKSPISYAVLSGHTEIITQALAANMADPNFKDKWGLSLLSLAVLYDREAIVRLLLERSDIDPNSRTIGGQTPLSIAASSEKEAMVKMLLEYDTVNINSEDLHGSTPLAHASSLGYTEIVDALLRKDGLEPDTKDDRGRTPLSRAAKSQEVAVIQLLLATGRVDPDSRDNWGLTPLTHAVTKNVWGGDAGAVVKLLLSTDGVDPNSRDFYGQTPLFHAVRDKYLKTTRLLLADNRVDPNSRDVNGRTPLSHAIKYGSEIVRLLLADNRVDPNSKDVNGRTPLSHAAKRGSKTIRVLLDDDRVDPNSRDNKGQTPLFHAVKRGPKAIRVLLDDDRVDPNSRDNKGQTPLFHAVGQHPRAIQLLLADNRVDPNLRDINGQSPLSHAARNGNTKSLQLLLLDNRTNLYSIAIGDRNLLSWVVENRYDMVVQEFEEDGAGDPDEWDDSDDYANYDRWDYLDDWDDWDDPELYIWRSTETMRILFAKDKLQNPTGIQNRTAPPGDVGVWYETVVRLIVANRLRRKMQESREEESQLVETTKLLLANDSIDLEFKDDSGRTLLWWAARCGFEEVVELLLARENIDPNSKDIQGMTPLHFAAQNGHYAVVKLLLGNESINPDPRDTFKRSPLSLAMCAGREDVVELLLTRDDVDIMSQECPLGESLLIKAAESGYHAVVKLLLARDGIELNFRDAAGRTPLSWAAAKGHVRTVKLLLAHGGVDVHAKDNEGRTPLSWAKMEGHLEVVDLLAVYGD